MTEFTHQANGTAKDVAKGLSDKRAELETGADSRGKQLVGAAIGAVQSHLRGVADDAQVTVTAQVSERTTAGKLDASQLYVDVTIIPAVTGDAAPVGDQAAAPVADAGAAK